MHDDEVDTDVVAKEQEWLPVLAPHLPLAVPLAVAAGEPEEAFPYPCAPKGLLSSLGVGPT